jgi:hypothetical protein
VIGGFLDLVSVTLVHLHVRLVKFVFKYTLCDDRVNDLVLIRILQSNPSGSKCECFSSINTFEYYPRPCDAPLCATCASHEACFADDDDTGCSCIDEQEIWETDFADCPVQNGCNPACHRDNEACKKHYITLIGGVESCLCRCCR